MNAFSRCAIALVALVVWLPAQAQLSQQEAAAFVAHVKGRLAAMSPTRQFTRQVPTGPSAGKWVKIEESLISSSVDVKRTDSLVDPAQGIVEFVERIRVSEPASSQIESEALPINERSYLQGTVQAAFVPTATAWAFKSGRYKAPDIPEWFEIKPDDLRRPMAEQRFTYRVLLDIERTTTRSR